MSQFLILLGIVLLLFGMVLTDREYRAIADAGEPMGGVPNCSVNPAFHYENVGVWVPECDPQGGSDERPLTVSAAYVLSLDGDDHERSFLARKRFLARHGIDLQRFPAAHGRELFGHEYHEETVASSNGQHVDDGTSNNTVLVWSKPGESKPLRPGKRGYLTPGERGYLRSMYLVLETALRDPAKESVLVIDDDALFTCEFEYDLARLLAEPRCAGIKGVLLLGAAIWIDGMYPKVGPWTGGWRLFDEERRMYEENTGLASSCGSTNSKTFGTFAVIYGRDAIPPILRWIESATTPFDHMFKSVAEDDVAIRVAYPFIAIQDVRHASQIDQNRAYQNDMEARAAIHRWNISNFCDADGQPLNLAADAEAADVDEPVGDAAANGVGGGVASE